MKVGDDMFQCFICYENLKDPHMCPCCSKPACYHCFIKCLEFKSECPNCRTILSMEKLVNCRWMKEIQEKNLKEEKCLVHSTEMLTVFCATCQLCVCDHCIVWEKEHSGHVLQKLDEVYNKQMKKLRDAVSEIENKLTSLQFKRDSDENQNKEVDVVIEKLLQSYNPGKAVTGECETIVYLSKIKNLKNWIEIHMKTLSKKDLISATKILLEKVSKNKKKEIHPSSHRPESTHTNYINLHNPDGLKSFLVRNVLNHVKKEDLHDVFSKYGQLKTVRINAEMSCAYIKFMNSDSAGEAMHNLQFTEILGQKIVLQFLSQTTDEKVERFRNPDDQKSLWVGNVAPDVTQDVLHDMFSKHGIVEEVRNIPSKSCAFVDFVDKESAEKAMQNLQSVNVLGKKLIIKFSNQSKQPTHKRSTSRIRHNSEDKFTGPVNGNECYFWRRKGCRFSDGCRYEHIPENKGIDLKSPII